MKEKQKNERRHQRKLQQKEEKLNSSNSYHPLVVGRHLQNLTIIIVDQKEFIITVSPYKYEQQQSIL